MKNTVALDKLQVKKVIWYWSQNYRIHSEAVDTQIEPEPEHILNLFQNLGISGAKVIQLFLLRLNKLECLSLARQASLLFTSKGQVYPCAPLERLLINLLDTNTL